MTRSEELMALEISLLLDMGRRYGQLVKKRTGSGASRSEQKIRERRTQEWIETFRRLSR